MRLAISIVGLLIMTELSIEGTEKQQGFDPLLYRAEIAEISKNIEKDGLPTLSEGLSDERKAAICYIARQLRSMVNVDLETKLRASDIVSKLFRKYPFSQEVFALRFRYWDAGHNPHYSPFLEMAYLYIAGGVTFTDEQWYSELESKFYISFLNMLERRRARLNVEKEDVSPGYDRSEFLYSFENTSPSEEDVRLWASLVIHYAKETNNESERWQFFVKRIETELAPGLKLLGKEQAHEKLAILVSQSIAINHLRRVEPEEVVKAFFRGRDQGKTEAEELKLPPELEAERKLKQARAARLSDNWEAHRELCEFYAKTPLRENPEYPPLQFAQPQSAFDFLVLAYYQLTVRTLTNHRDEAVKLGLEMTEKALNLDPQSARGYALRAIALHLLDNNDDAEESLNAALAIDPDLAEVIRARRMLNPPLPPGKSSP